MSTAAEPSDAVLATLWSGPTGTKRGPKPRFSLDVIARAAIELADVDGLDAVTMQRVAERLGTTKMALYRYVPGRAELDAVMLDRGLGPVSLPEPDQWRPGLEAWARAVHARTARHPWSVELTQRPHVPGPLELGWYEAGLSAMAPLPLSGAEKLDTLFLLVSHVLSIQRQEAVPDPEAALARGIARIMDEHRADYPHTATAFASSASGSGRALEFGIERILDGVAALAARRA
ncbi:TetR/AcrR family transcriptional regulator [Microbacterium protaetiae]|uniref:TetR/AcrR family transcriptional regulator n=1 Tax=Microbacterium protaetiae TaxID=2509458 RepID=A0A4P6E9V1_9MICO|nr:TetR/AcrR family transcriptional regulator [Microbacterium protaetiae]QAY58902.1 TetR/AcrR family transcriptional regulator [Microbacterium protaetiae]